MGKEVKVSYDKENDILLLYKENVRARGSVEVGDFIINSTQDMNKAVGVEILNATKILSEVANQAITKLMLSNIIKANIKTVHKPDVIYVFYGFVWKLKQQENKVSAMVPLAVAVSY